MIRPWSLRGILPFDSTSARGLSLPWKKLLWFDLLLLAFLILGTRLATVLHELLGHALATILSGGDVTGVRISLLGGGRVLHRLPEAAGVWIRFLVAWSGIAVNLTTGALILFRFRRRSPDRLLHGFWILFAGASLLGGTAYAALGLYYGQGDPVDWMEALSPAAVWFAVPFLLAAPFLGFAAVKTYSDWSRHWFSADTLVERAVVLLLTVGVATTAYAGLYHATGARSRALDSPKAAMEQARRQVAVEQMETLVQLIRKVRPDLTEEQVRARLRVVRVAGEPVDVPKKPPLKPALALLYSVGAFLAVRRVFATVPSPGRIPGRAVIAAAVLAAGVLTVLALTGGWLYRVPGG